MKEGRESNLFIVNEESKVCGWNGRVRFSEHGTLQAWPCDSNKCGPVRRRVGPMQGTRARGGNWRHGSRGGPPMV